MYGSSRSTVVPKVAAPPAYASPGSSLRSSVGRPLAPTGYPTPARLPDRSVGGGGLIAERGRRSPFRGVPTERSDQDPTTYEGREIGSQLDELARTSTQVRRSARATKNDRFSEAHRAPPGRLRVHLIPIEFFDTAYLDAENTRSRQSASVNHD